MIKLYFWKNNNSVLVKKEFDELIAAMVSSSIYSWKGFRRKRSWHMQQINSYSLSITLFFFLFNAWLFFIQSGGTMIKAAYLITTTNYKWRLILVQYKIPSSCLYMLFNEHICFCNLTLRLKIQRLKEKNKHSLCKPVWLHIYSILELFFIIIKPKKHACLIG